MSCFSMKYNNTSEQHLEAGPSVLRNNFHNCEKSTHNCKRCVEFTNNLTKHAIIKRDLNNNLKDKEELKSVAMKKPEEIVSNIIEFFTKLQKTSQTAHKHFKLTQANTEYTLGENFIKILQSFLFGETSKFDFGIYTDAYKLYKKEKRQLKSVQAAKYEKPPRKGTLKHRRWKLNKLQTDASYEDDLFDSAQLNNSIELWESDSDSCDKYKNAPTPKMNFSLSPRESAESSEIEDCFSPEDFQRNRKVAEEYQFRLKQKRKKPLKAERHSPYSCASKLDPARTLQNAARVLKEWESLQEDSDEESSQSSDVSDLC
ncbi:uncharacterized protein LOC129223884 [Uloborus diversus]|uniref:uncharacterized protein LOC129223884 n=1 Tax=Uloborus diversus TaxID=327109 RepID=UPI00240A1355|nr:uncharacterized protein LOC129223884 [Uloborus diversus]XP_054714230.1 uncharacterized protein LOC129223884 [Uloborus diversus]